jgi:hypothetical protein
MSVLTPHLPLHTAGPLYSPYKSAYHMLAQSVVLWHYSIGSPASQSPVLLYGDLYPKLNPKGNGTEFKETDRVGDKTW